MPSSGRWSPLTVAAEATQTLHVGTLVLNNDLRNPVVLAKEIASLGLAAEGRVEVGLGAGWLRTDYEEMRDRLRRHLVAGGAAGREPDRHEVALERGGGAVRGHALHGARRPLRSSPETPPRIIVGGGGKRVLTVAAQQADTWG